MSEFIFLYRAPASATPPSPQVMQERMKSWSTWMKGLEEKGSLVSAGHPLDPRSGAVVKDNAGSINDGPYAESKDLVLGYSIVRAKDLAEAVKLSNGCPMLVGGGGLVEVRPIMQM